MNPDQDRLPSKPVRNWLLAWHIHTGDPPELIAKGFDLDPLLVEDLLGPALPRWISVVDARAVLFACRLDSRDLWGWCSDSSSRGDICPLTTDLPASLLSGLGLSHR